MLIYSSSFININLHNLIIIPFIKIINIFFLYKMIKNKINKTEDRSVKTSDL